jgi:long-subunit acyl-CoA synthetase (AMP-forming)
MTCGVILSFITNNALDLKINKIKTFQSIGTNLILGARHMQEYETNLSVLEDSPKNFQSIYKIIMNNDSIACEFLEDGQIVKWTYQDYNRKIVKAASKLSGLCANIDQNSYIALKMPNSPLWPVLFWSILMSGYKPLLVDAALREEGTAYLMRQAGAKMLLTAPFDFENEDASDFTPQWSNEYALCTSGTTATRKIYYYTGEAVCYQILNTRRLVLENERIRPLKVDKILAFLPFHHIFGFIATYIWFSFYGSAFVYTKDRAPKTILEACRLHGVTHILTVPILPNNVAKSVQKKLNQMSVPRQIVVKSLMELSLLLQRINPEWGLRVATEMFQKMLANLMGPQIKVIICGGSYTSSKTLRMMNAFGYYTVCGYGMTEVGITSCESSMDLDKRLTGSIGKPLKYVEYRIGGAKGVGDLYIRGVSIHSGRLANGRYRPADTDGDGWLNSEDIVRHGRDSYWIEGRSKEIIINESGENIYPDELEGIFEKLAVQGQLCVLGIKRDAASEYITLVISIPEGNLTKEDYHNLREAINAINNTLPIKKRVNKVYLTTEPLPLVNGIKIKRKQLKAIIETRSIDLVELGLGNAGIKFIHRKKSGSKANLTEDELYRRANKKIKAEI